MRKSLYIVVILVTFSGFQARADEGMWLLPLIEKLNLGKMNEYKERQASLAADAMAGLQGKNDKFGVLGGKKSRRRTRKAKRSRKQSRRRSRTYSRRR